jgi:hypothetical protein
MERREEGRGREDEGKGGREEENKKEIRDKR